MTEAKRTVEDEIRTLIAQWFWAEMDYRKTPSDENDRDEKWEELQLAITAIIEERNRAVRERDEAIEMFHAKANDERDAMKVRVGELEKQLQLRSTIAP